MTFFFSLLLSFFVSVRQAARQAHAGLSERFEVLNQLVSEREVALQQSLLAHQFHTHVQVGQKTGKERRGRGKHCEV